jgi:hypothetical protein
MKRLIVLSLLTVMLLAGGILAPAQAQSPANDLKPTFMSPTPGLYINGWPAFTVSYPKEWVEGVWPGAVFRAGVPRPNLPPSPVLTIYVPLSPLPLEDWAKLLMPTYNMEIATDFMVRSDKPSRLKDGTPSREVELEYVLKNGPKAKDFILMTKTDLAWVVIALGADEGKPGEDLKRIAYSLTFQPGREKPVQVPPDVRAFLDMYCADFRSGDVNLAMAHFSDRYFEHGSTKAFIEQWFRNDPHFQQGSISCEATVTVFEPHGDKAYVDGFFLIKGKGETSAVRVPMIFRQIINEHGQWRWYGTQK